MTRYTSQSDVLDELFCFDLYAASGALTRRYRPLLKEHGLTYPQYLVLVVQCLLTPDGPLEGKSFHNLSTSGE